MVPHHNPMSQSLLLELPWLTHDQQQLLFLLLKVQYLGASGCPSIYVGVDLLAPTHIMCLSMNLKIWCRIFLYTHFHICCGVKDIVQLHVVKWRRSQNQLINKSKWNLYKCCQHASITIVLQWIIMMS